ncbi:MAG: tRNA pseudouridine38-40 synthase [Acidimicrobiaceae bacterium]|jgi:tRNA pseudouridine38-40 synthase|nr:tRNA pseudouridine38-40 synthase [Acidimicrobiaceae bacterium]
MTLFEPEPPAAPEGPLVRVRLLIAYAGGGFRGFAVQAGVRTVAGELAKAMERVVRHRVQITCAGRTDAGVHAWGQVVHVDVRPPVDLDGLQRACTKMLGPEIVVRSAELAADGFDARRSATERRYRYTILNTPVPNPFLAATTWHVDAPLDLRAMALACDPLYGEHDFSSFCRKPPAPDASLVRIVRHAGWQDTGEGQLRFEVAASSFCQQMVRALVGTMVDVGLGRKRAGDMAWMLRSRDRSKAGQLAPPHGLCLWEVTYNDLSSTLHSFAPQ